MEAVSHELGYSSKSGEVDLEEFVIGLARYCRGGKDDKIKFVFEMCDLTGKLPFMFCDDSRSTVAFASLLLSGTGKVTRSELEAVLNALLFAADAMKRREQQTSPEQKDNDSPGFEQVLRSRLSVSVSPATPKAQSAGAATNGTANTQSSALTAGNAGDSKNGSSAPGVSKPAAGQLPPMHPGSAHSSPTKPSESSDNKSLAGTGDALNNGAMLHTPDGISKARRKSLSLSPINTQQPEPVQIDKLSEALSPERLHKMVERAFAIEAKVSNLPEGKVTAISSYAFYQYVS
jgi:hypothetical protein